SGFSRVTEFMGSLYSEEICYDDLQFVVQLSTSVNGKSKDLVVAQSHKKNTMPRSRSETSISQPQGQDHSRCMPNTHEDQKKAFYGSENCRKKTPDSDSLQKQPACEGLGVSTIL
ncbi:mCG145226, partial [Mus musculus]